MGMLVEDVKAILVRLENSGSPHVENSCIRIIADFIRQRGERLRANRIESERVIREPDPEAAHVRD